MNRDTQLQALLDRAFEAFGQCVTHEQSRASLHEIVTRVSEPREVRVKTGSRSPACETWLDIAMNQAFAEPCLQALMDAFRLVEPRLVWKARPAFDHTASANFPSSHANTMIAGPGGLEDRMDVMLGVSYMAPHVRYPDHTHAPEETYLIMSEGEFRHGDSGWFTPGIGGSFYNVPNINHAMRSGEKPLFAFWALLPN